MYCKVWSGNCEGTEPLQIVYERKGSETLREEVRNRQKRGLDIIKRYQWTINEILTMEMPESFVYFSDPETYEVLYISNEKFIAEELKRDHYQGEKCYEVFQGRSAPCPFCTNHLLSRDHYYTWTRHNPFLNNDYILKDKFVDLNGRTVRMEIATALEGHDAVLSALEESFKSQNILMNCIQPMLDEADQLVAQRRIMDNICPFFDAEWGTIHSCGEYPTLVEWGSRPEGMRSPGKLPSAYMQECGKLLSSSSQILIMDTESIRETDPENYEFLKAEGVTSLCCTPIFIGKELAGMITIGNFTKHQSDITILFTLAFYIASLMQREALYRKKLRLEYYDVLTGSLNLEGFRREAGVLFAAASPSEYSIWYCDIKNFKYINDLFGFHTGNRILKYWASCLKENCREAEIFCRVSDDNFAFLWKRNEEQKLQERFERLVEKLASFTPFKEKNYQVEVNSGVFIPESSCHMDMDELLNRANMAQKSVKNLRGSRPGFFTEELRIKALNEIQMESEMRAALADGEFVLYLQPQVKLRKVSGQKKHRAEALVRWMRGGQIYAMPDDFIGLFEKNGMIAGLDQYLYEKICILINRLKENGMPSVCIAVNVSRHTMIQPEFVETYIAIRDKYQIGNDELELEFTESIAVEDLELMQQILKKLKTAGFICAMDDFGTGYSSLNVLQVLPLDILKLDRGFLASEGEDVRRQIVVESVLQMAKRLNMLTIVEGVESREQLHLLQKLDCDYLQGFLVSPPLSEDEYRSFIKEGEIHGGESEIQQV